jgi:chromosome partitioning protein
MRVIAVVNQKGGVGKTSTAVNVGHALARRGAAVMLADLDPQGHLAASLGVHRPPLNGMDQVLGGASACDRLAIPLRDGMRLLASGEQLDRFARAEAGKSLAYVLQRALVEHPPGVDYLVLDCPPASGLLMVNAIVAADDLLIPVAGDYLSLTGVARLMLMLRRVAPLQNRPRRETLFLSRFVERRRLAREVRDKLCEHFPEQFVDCAISESAVLAECPGLGRTIFEHSPASRVAAEFRALADTLLNRGNRRYEQEAPSHVA